MIVDYKNRQLYIYFYTEYQRWKKEQKKLNKDLDIQSDKSILKKRWLSSLLAKKQAILLILKFLKRYKNWKKRKSKSK